MFLQMLAQSNTGFLVSHCQMRQRWCSLVVCMSKRMGPFWVYVSQVIFGDINKNEKRTLADHCMCSVWTLEITK